MNFNLQIKPHDLVSSTSHALRRLLLPVSLCLFSTVHGQSLPNPLHLGELLQAAAGTYPTMLAARQEARASGQDVLATERIRWPTLSTTLETNTGSANVSASRAVQLEQPIWDFGRSKALIAESQTLSDISQIKVQLVQQDVYLQVVMAWQNLIASNERVRFAKLTRSRLVDYQAQIRRRVQAEASPRIDLELADARLLQTEVELLTAQTSLQVTIRRLEQLSGMQLLAERVPNATYPLSKQETQSFLNELDQTDLQQVALVHPVTAKARMDVLVLRRTLDAKNSEAYPQVYARVVKPIGAGSSSNDLSTTYFLGMRYTPGPGFSNLIQAQAIGMRIDGAEQSIDTAIREMQQTLQTDREEFVNARHRIEALEKSVASSAVVLESYQRQFQAGRKQWQDLLNQVRELAQNQYALADAQASMVGAQARLQIRMGQVPK